MLLFFVRHGHPIYNPDQLTPLGELQASAVAKRLCVHGIDKIYASTSNRAIQTATPTAQILNKEITQIDFFNEHYAANYYMIHNKEGRHVWADSQLEMQKIFMSEEVRQLGDKWYEHPEFSSFKFKEADEFYKDKIDDFMLSLGYEHDRKNHLFNIKKGNSDRVAIFAHQGFGGVFLSSILDIPYPQFVAHYDMSHTGVTAIYFDESGEYAIPQVLQFSNDSHIYREGLPTKFFLTMKGRYIDI